MIAAAHLTVGAGIVVLARDRLGRPGTSLNLAWAFVLGVFSHLVLDAIPHGEYPNMPNTYFATLILFEFVLVSFSILSRRNSDKLNLPIFFGMSGAAAPDLLRIIGEISHFQWLVDISNTIHLFHASHNSPFEISFGLQVTLSLMLIVYFLRLTHKFPK